MSNKICLAVGALLFMVAPFTGFVSYAQQLSEEEMFQQVGQMVRQEKAAIQTIAASRDQRVPGMPYNSADKTAKMINFLADPVATVLVTAMTSGLEIDNHEYNQSESEKIKRMSELMNYAILFKAVQALDNYHYKVIFKDTDAASLRVSKEEYVDQLISESKNLGAQYLLMTDWVVVNFSNIYQRSFLQVKMIDVSTNHQYSESVDTGLSFLDQGYGGALLSSETQSTIRDIKAAINAGKINKESEEFNKRTNDAIRSLLRRMTPSYFEMRNLKGKKAELISRKVKYPFYTINDEDVLSVYQPSLISYEINTKNKDFIVLEQVGQGIGKNTTYEIEKLDGGQGLTHLIYKMDQAPKDIIGEFSSSKYDFTTTFTSANPDPSVLFNIPLYNNAVVFFSLPYDLTSVEGYLRYAVDYYTTKAIESLPFVSFINGDLFAQTKKQRQQLRTEEMIETQTAVKIATDAGKYVLNIADYNGENDIVSFSLELIETATGEILRSNQVKCHVTRLEEVIQNTIKDVLIRPVFLKDIQGNNIQLLSESSLFFPKETPLILSLKKKDINPVTGENTEDSTDLAFVEYLEYQGQQHTLQVKKILDNKEFKAIKKSSATQGQLYLRAISEDVKNPEKSGDPDYDKSLKAKKRNSFMEKMSESVNMERGGNGMKLNLGGGK